jgi:hypothetical protein
VSNRTRRWRLRPIAAGRYGSIVVASSEMPPTVASLSALRELIMDVEAGKKCDLSHTSGRAGTRPIRLGLCRCTVCHSPWPSLTRGVIDHQGGASPLSGFFLGVATTAAAPIGAITTRVSSPDAAPQVGYTAKFEFIMIPNQLAPSAVAIAVMGRPRRRHQDRRLSAGRSPLGPLPDGWLPMARDPDGHPRTPHSRKPPGGHCAMSEMGATAPQAVVPHE